MKRVESGQINKKTGKFTSMNAMRDAKGFQEGESASQFNKRRMALEVAKKAGKATTIGKIVLPIAAAGVAGAAYLKNKLKKEDKKMGGGMAKKYSKGGDLRAEYIHSQTKKNRKITGEGYFTERSATRREEYGAAKDRYPNKMDRRKQMLKNLSRVAAPTMSAIKGVYDGLNASTTRKYSIGTGPLGATKKPLQQGRASLPSSDIEKNKRQRLSADEIFKIKDSKQKFTGPKETKNSFGEMINKFRETEAGIKAMAKKIYPEKYLVGGVSSKEVYTNARANVDAEGRKNMTMKDLKEARRETYSTKKMVGGMAKKYSVGGGMMQRPMGYSSGSKLMDFIKSGSYTDKYGTKTNVDKAIKKINLSPKDKDLATMKPASDKKMMGGGMMNKPMGYKSGTMVKARGCKLGRTRPTKMY